MIKFENSAIEVVWLDLDDTLIDFEANSRESLRQLYAIERLDRFFASPEAWIECYEKHNKEMWTLYSMQRITREFLRRERFVRPLTEGGMDSDEAAAAWTRMDVTYLDLLAAQRRTIDGTFPLLEALRRAGVKTGVLSNGFKEVQHRKIESAGLTPYIDHVVLSDDIGVNKPDARLYRHAEAVSGVNRPDAHLMIGDNAATDIAGALKAGWHAIHFAPGESAPVSRAGNYMRVSALDHIHSILSLK